MMTVDEFNQLFPSHKNGKSFRMSFEAKVLGTNEKLRCVTYSDTAVFVYNKGSRKYGRAINTDYFLSKATPIIKRKDEGAEWHSRCKSCEQRLAKSGLFPEYREMYHNLQKIPYSEWEQMRSELDYNDSSDKAKLWIKKYPFLTADGIHINSNYLSGLAWAKLKTMYFGKYDNARIKAEIKQALKEKRAYYVSRQVNYDVSFNYTPEKNNATYSEEYRGCGNGHYYLALDESAAVYYEDD